MLLIIMLGVPQRARSNHRPNTQAKRVPTASITNNRAEDTHVAAVADAAGLIVDSTIGGKSCDNTGSSNGFDALPKRLLPRTNERPYFFCSRGSQGIGAAHVQARRPGTCHPLCALCHGNGTMRDSCVVGSIPLSLHPENSTCFSVTGAPQPAGEVLQSIVRRMP